MSFLEGVQIVAAAIAGIAAAIASYFGLKLSHERLEFEKKAKNIQDRQQQMLEEVSESSRHLLTQAIKAAPSFLYSPYPQLVPSPTPLETSLFDLRRSHFAPEKRLLAEKVVSQIRQDIEADKDLTVILVLDAGSTVFPIFRQLCSHPTFQFARENARRIKIITNNLPGVSDLVKYGRIDDPDKARTLFKCRILRGFAHSQYEASLSDYTATDLCVAIAEFSGVNHLAVPKLCETVDASSERVRERYDDLLKAEAKDQEKTVAQFDEAFAKFCAAIIGFRQEIQKNNKTKIKVVSVTTGNYVSIPEGLLARDKNHVQVKSAVVGVGDEVYVLAPLGKLLPYPHDEINALRGDRQTYETLYHTLPNWPEKSEVLKMVVTVRDYEYFEQLGQLLAKYFNGVQHDASRTYGERLLPVRFDPTDEAQIRSQMSLLGTERTLREYELPHRYLRENLMRKLELDKSLF